MRSVSVTAAVADTDTDLQIRGKGRERHPDPEIRGKASLQNFFSDLWASVWSKKEKERGPPGSATALGHGRGKLY